MQSNALMPLGGEILIRDYAGASFAVCKVKRQSKTGFIILHNSAPIFLFSEKQGYCETSTFGSKFVAMK